jgi:hypothetical protein
VLPHDQPDSATTIMVANARMVLDIFALLPSSTPHLSQQHVRRGLAASMADASHTECRQPCPCSPPGGSSARKQVQRKRAASVHVDRDRSAHAVSLGRDRHDP